ncbi:MAG: sialate O-acetylesterase [Synoicihabitans sp.]
MSVLLSLGLVGCATLTDPVVAPMGEMHLFLLAGQSNMAGRGEVMPEHREPIPGVWALQRDGSWGPAIDPLHWDKTIAGVGLARDFARAYLAANPGVEIGFIPAACGGSPVESWQPAVYFTPTDSFPYDDALARVRAVREKGILKGMLWHQGESDSPPARAIDYEQRLSELFARFRADLGVADLPILVGQLGQFPEKPWTPGRAQVDAAHQAIAQKDRWIEFVSSTGLGAKDDMVHFDAPALAEFGRRYAAAWQRLERETRR